MRRSVLHVLRTKENAVKDLTRLSESDARFSFILPSDHRYAAFYQCVQPHTLRVVFQFISYAGCRYVILATAAVEQKESDKVAAAAAALAAKDPEETETENATESETAAVDLIDPLLSAEAAQLRRKRLEVSACSQLSQLSQRAAAAAGVFLSTRSHKVYPPDA
jgi:hypothetical protein